MHIYIYVYIYIYITGGATINNPFAGFHNIAAPPNYADNFRFQIYELGDPHFFGNLHMLMETTSRHICDQLLISFPICAMEWIAWNGKILDWETCHWHWIVLHNQRNII